MEQQDNIDAALSAMDTKFFGEAPEEVQDEQSPTEEPDQEQAEATEEVESEEVEAQPAAEEFFEFEADDGERVKVPAKLKDAFLRRDDYTRKTMELAPLSEHMKASLEAVQMMQAFEQQVQSERVELAQVKSTLDQFKQLDWMNMDVDTHLKMRAQRDQYVERAQELENQLRSKAQQFHEATQQNRQRLLTAGQEYLKRAIPGWDQSKAGEVAQYASEVGYQPAEIKSTDDPRFVRLAWEAAQYRKLQASKGKAVQSAQKAPPVLKPGSVDPAMSAKMQKLNWHKSMKNAKSDAEKRSLAVDRLANSKIFK